MNTVALFSCPILKNIPEDQQEKFLEDLCYNTKHYKKGDFIAYQGDDVNLLYILLTGSVKTEMILESGSVMDIETIAAPYPLASAFLFAENNKFPVDVVALEECEVMLIRKESVLIKLSSNEIFLQAYIAFNSNKTNFLSKRIKLLSIKTIKGKLAQYILERSHKSQFSLEKNQTELAKYFGVARPSLARSLSEMIDDGIIELHKNEGKILNINKMKDLLL